MEVYDMATRAASKKGSRPATKKGGSKKKLAAKKKPAATAASAKGLKVRMYRVGFGDFFLITVPTKAGDRYILIDCGVFKGTSQTGDIGSIKDAVEDLYKTTGGQLALVIMTHRHADHIAGFDRSSETFKKFTASLVWMPYWEQFNDAEGSANHLQAEIEELAQQLAMQFRGRTDETAQMALDLLWDATGIDFNASATGGKRNTSNGRALDLLKNHLGDNGKKVRYYAAGDKPELPPELKGLSAEILGPPPKDAQVFLKLEDLKVGVGQFLDSMTDSDKAIEPFRPLWRDDQHKHYPSHDVTGRPIKYEEIMQRVNKSQPDMLAAAAIKIDEFLNNQSLVVLFKFAGKTLLFVGDAQAGNWEHWLYKLEAPVKDPTKAGNLTEKSQQILQNIDFYKVGHHGSTNSTPIQAVEALGTDRTAGGIVAMCSTEVDVYGNPLKGTEVPREPLMKALGDECTLVRSDSLAISVAGKKIPAFSALPKPKVGKLTKGKLYIEYSF
jgi:beta-lactamase superfamily II metal-dependent hydrolase